MKINLLYLPRRLVGRMGEHFRPKAHIVSFPKCGRTWLRVMLGKVFYLHYGVNDQRPDGTSLLYPEGANQHLRMPLVDFTHDDNPHRKLAHELAADKSHFRNEKIILLIRDLRDVMVSNYFEETYRRPHYDFSETDTANSQSLSQFLYQERGGVDSFLTFYNIWAASRKIPKKLMLLRYEDLRQNTAHELQRILAFLDVSSAISNQTIAEAIDFADFQRMQRMERDGQYKHTPRLRPGDLDEPKSFKVRRGKVGGYKDYLSAQEIAWLTERLENNLSPYYGYQTSLA